MKKKNVSRLIRSATGGKPNFDGPATAASKICVEKILRHKALARRFDNCFLQTDKLLFEPYLRRGPLFAGEQQTRQQSLLSLASMLGCMERIGSNE
jgi:hypothetical protein